MAQAVEGQPTGKAAGLPLEAAASPGVRTAWRWLRRRLWALKPWLLWAMHVKVALVLALWLGLIVLPRLHGAHTMASYRLAMRELSESVRAMRARAQAQDRMVQLRIDAAHGQFQVVSQRYRPRHEVVEQTIWLPKGLSVNEAPKMVAALPNGFRSAGDIVVAAPAYNRLFRLTMTAQGKVELHEEPML